MTNFQPEQASDNVAARSNTSDVNSMQSVYSDLGSSYMREAASLSGSSSSSDSSSKSSSDLQESLNAGLQTTDQLYGGSPTSGLGFHGTGDTSLFDTSSSDTNSGDTRRSDTSSGDTNTGENSADSANAGDTDGGEPRSDSRACKTDAVDVNRGDAVSSTANSDRAETSEAPKPETGDLRSEVQRRAEHRSDVVHDRPEMSMARSAGGG